MRGSEAGISRRLHRILPSSGALILPLDGGLIDGPTGSLRDTERFLEGGVLTSVDAILGYQGLLSACGDLLRDKPFISNLSASTALVHTTTKTSISDVETAVRLGADCVCYQIHLSDDSETVMLHDLGSVIADASRFGMPVMVTAYPRRQVGEIVDNFRALRDEQPEAYVSLVAHVVRVAAELGADLIKTAYTGSPESFAIVAKAGLGVPIVAAGGPAVTLEQAVANARGAMTGGASGIAYGRQIFLAEDPVRVARELKAAIADASRDGAPRL